MQRLGLGQPVGGLQEMRQIVEVSGHVGMIGTEALLVDGERAAHQRLGLRKPVRGLKQQRQIVEVSGHIGMIGAEALLVDGERAAHQRLRLGEPVRGLKQLRQIVEGCRVFGGGVAVTRRRRRRILLCQGYCFVRFAGSIEIHDAAVHGVQICFAGRLGEGRRQRQNGCEKQTPKAISTHAAASRPQSVAWRQSIITVLAEYR